MSFGIPEPEKTSIISSFLLHDQGIMVLGILFLILVFGAGLGWFSQTHIKYYRQIKLRVALRKIRAKQLMKILEGLARTTCEQRVRDLLGESLLDIIEQIMDINPKEPGIKIIYAAAQKLIVLPAKQTTYNLSIADSDADLKKLKLCVLGAIAQLKKLPRRGLMTYSECKALEKHLKMIYVQVEVDAHLQKADLAVESNNKGAAANHYRIAQNKLAQSRYHGPEKRSKMIELGATIRGLFENPKKN